MLLTFFPVYPHVFLLSTLDKNVINFGMLFIAWHAQMIDEMVVLAIEVLNYRKI